MYQLNKNYITMNNKKKLKTSIFLYLSILSLFYFILLIFWSYNPPNEINYIRFIGEILTIPFLLLVLFSFFYSVYFLLKKSLIKLNLVILGVNLICIIMLIYVTIIQTN